jgi:hypothetical protein
MAAAMDDNTPRYSFDPLERRGVLLGLQPGQIAVAASGVILAWTAARTLPTPAGVVSAVSVAVMAALATLVTKDGQPVPTWAAIAARWLLGGLKGAVLSTAPERGTVLQPRSTAAPVRRHHRRDGPLKGVEIVDLPAEPGEAPLGAVLDRTYGTLSSVVPVRGGPFALMEPSEQARRLELWRVTLNTLGRPGKSVRRIQWIERTQPAPSEMLVDLASSVRACEPRRAKAADSYLQVVADVGTTAQVHELWLVTTVSTPAGPPLLASRKAADMIRRDTRLLAGQLRSADLRTDGPLDGKSIARVIELAHAEDPALRRIGSLDGWWPLGDEELWSVYRADGTWHATYWIAEWPRIEIGPEFMSPLLLSGQRRSISLTMAPVSPDRAAREARSARTADVADEHLRSRAGFLPSARRDREADGPARREAELADGHAEYRFTGYVTVTACSRPDLDAACAETEQAALAAHLEIRRLYGRQREAFTWTLPLGRGLR